jgi:hypothetical protein
MPFAPETSVISRISNLLNEINGETKQASNKRADDGTVLDHSGQGSKDPGGYQGPSSHPSAKVDSNTQAAPIGSRFRENHSDMKDQFAVGNVDRTSAGGGGDQDAKQIEQGTDQSSTGQEPKVEDHYKGRKDDPGTTHPANAEEVGPKYGSMHVGQLTKMAYDRMNECLADMANGVYLNKQGSQLPTSRPLTEQQKQAQAAAQAGYELAASVPNFELEKAAAVNGLIEHWIKTAEEDADIVADFLYKYAAERERELHKQADDVMPPMPPGGAAGPGGDPTGGGAPPMLPPDAAAGPGGGPGGGPGPDMGGGPPPGADMGGGPPGGGPGGGGGEEEAINELANALLELGVSPEQLIAAMQGAGGGGGGEGGGPPGLEGGPPGGEKAGAARMAADDRHLFVTLMHKVAAHSRTGRMQIKEARPGTPLRAERDEIKGYIRDVCGIR